MITTRSFERMVDTVKANETINRLGSGFRRMTKRRETTVLFIVICICVVLGFVTPTFLTPSNLRATAMGFATDGIIAIGMTAVLISGGFDLSVGSVMAFSGVVAATLHISAGWNIWVSCLCAIIISGVIGLINGVIIGKVGLSPFITTLGMMEIARGATYVVTKGSPVSLSSAPAEFINLGKGSVGGIPNLVIILAVMVIVSDYAMKHVAAIRSLFYAGSNEKAAILSGINTRKVKIKVYVFSAMIAGLAGILSVSRYTVAATTAGDGAEMRAISAAVIGGASLNGGEGTVLGAIMGIILLNVIDNALVLLQVSVYWQQVISGSILVLAVMIDHLSHRKKS